MWELAQVADDKYAFRGVLKTHGLEIPVRVPSDIAEKMVSKNLLSDVGLVEIDCLDEAWQIFSFEDGTEMPVQINAVHGEWIEALSLAGLLPDVDLHKWRLAQAAKVELEAAKEKYENAIKEIGGAAVDNGCSYEDFDWWYAIPGVPGRY